RQGAFAGSNRPWPVSANTRRWILACGLKPQAGKNKTRQGALHAPPTGLGRFPRSVCQTPDSSGG
ncbi:MAG: hypothetical protein M1434_01385, partial [Chloroflexi bacterium]|nr:hypothetical protein [Chloroflexota bacterium]